MSLTKENEDLRDNVYNSSLFFLPLPNILISGTKLRAPLDSINLGHPIDYYNWCKDETPDGIFKKRNFSQFIKNLSNLNFNYQHFPLKYRMQLKEYFYIHKTAIHTPFPLYGTTSHNSFLRSIQKKIPLILNPTIKVSIYPIGVVQFLLIFQSSSLPPADKLQILNNEFFKHLKSIKLSVIQALYKTEEASNVYGSIIPNDGFSFHICTNNKEGFPPNKNLGWKSLGQLKTTPIKIFLLHDKRFIIQMNRKSKTLRNDILLPLFWGTCLRSIIDQHSTFILRHMQDDTLVTSDFEGLWIATAASLNPIIHYATYPGKSPYFCKLYQKEIFQKYNLSQKLEQKYNTFISSLKKQAIFFSPLAHKTLHDFQQRNILDPRIGLYTEIHSNLRRISYPTFEELTEIEQKIIKVLLKKYNQDLEQAEAGFIIGTQNMGWMALIQIGKELGLSDYQIYSKTKKCELDLKQLLILMAKKQVVETRDLSRGRILESRVDVRHNLIKLSLGKYIYRSE